MECAHANLTPTARVDRVTDKESGFKLDIRSEGQEEVPPKLIYSVVSVTLKCADCGAVFKPVGAESGISPYKPTISNDLEQGRFPFTEDGNLPPHGLPTFTNNKLKG